MVKVLGIKTTLVRFPSDYRSHYEYCSLCISCLFLEQRLYLLFDGLYLYAYLVCVLPILFYDTQTTICADRHPTRDKLHCSTVVWVNGVVAERTSVRDIGRHINYYNGAIGQAHTKHYLFDGGG